MVGERTIRVEAAPKGAREYPGGLYGSDNAGISNDKKGENPFRRKPKVSRVKSFFPGLGGA